MLALVPDILRQARAAYDGRMLLMKGVEVAALYPDPLLRPFADMDLLVDDAERAQQALLDAGFEEVNDPELFVGIHHRRQLAWRGAEPVVELHSRPKWPDGMEAPPVAEIFGAAVPSSQGLEGLLAPRADHHALLVAAHMWAHEPLLRVGQLLDVALLATGDRPTLAALARRWNVEHIWTSTIRTADSLFHGGSGTVAERLWARNLRDVRDRTVLEGHLTRWLAPFWARPPAEALAEVGSVAWDEVRPAQGEGWGAKARRTSRAARNAFARRSVHDRELGPEARLRRR